MGKKNNPASSRSTRSANSSTRTANIYGQNQNNFSVKSFDNQIMTAIGKFTCVRCQKSLRPTPEQLLTLLLNLEKIEIQIFEGQLVQNLIERFLDWQGRTKRILTEVASFDEATDELIGYNHSESGYPDKLKNWIKMYCPHEAKQKLEEYNGKDYKLISNTDTRQEDSNVDEADELDDEVEAINSQVPAPKLNEELMNNIINVQVEGDLVEVKLPESDMLWLVMRRFGLVPSGCELWYDYQVTKKGNNK